VAPGRLEQDPFFRASSPGWRNAGMVIHRLFAFLVVS
jgi:hypothetical protein